MRNLFWAVFFLFMIFLSGYIISSIDTIGNLIINLIETIVGKNIIRDNLLLSNGSDIVKTIFTISTTGIFLFVMFIIARAIRRK